MTPSCEHVFQYFNKMIIYPIFSSMNKFKVFPLLVCKFSLGWHRHVLIAIHTSPEWSCMYYFQSWNKVQGILCFGTKLPLWMTQSHICCSLYSTQIIIYAIEVFMKQIERGYPFSSIVDSWDNIIMCSLLSIFQPSYHLCINPSCENTESHSPLNEVSATFEYTIMSSFLTIIQPNDIPWINLIHEIKCMGLPLLGFIYRLV